MPLPEEGDCRPRLCTLRKWDHFSGYGFNLQAEKGKPGQFIGYVDTNSPAEACGLRKNDRVIEVNGVNVCNESHKQVVARIRENPDEVSLLLMDSITEKHFLENGVVVKSSMDIVEKHEVPVGSPSNGVQADIETQPVPGPSPEPEELQNTEAPPAEESVAVIGDAPADHEEAALVKETEELTVESVPAEAPIEEEAPKEEEEEQQHEELAPPHAEAPTEEEPCEEESKVEEIIEPTPVAEENANHVTTVTNSGDVDESTAEDNKTTAATPVVVQSGPNEAASNTMNGNNHSADPMNIFQRPASEVRAMHGRSKRRAIKETNQTFKEKYHVFENL